MLIDINGIQLKFPFEPYALQKDYMRKVIEALDKKENAVLESPTGTGKTLCLLTSTLAWLVKNNEEAKKSFGDTHEKPEAEDDSSNIQNESKVIYTSRTHSQQAMKELKVTEYNHLRGVALGSRDQLCINEDVLKEATTSSDKIHMCRAKVKSKQCGYHSEVEAALNSSIVQMQPILDIEDLVKVGRTCNACPFYLAKKLADEADIVFLPYNYVLDPKILNNTSLKLENSIVILDEAHNVEKVCQDAASVQIASSDIATCIENINHIKKLLTDDPYTTNDFNIADCNKFLEMISVFKESFEAIELVTSKGRTLPGGKIFDFLDAAQMTQQTYVMIGQLVKDFLTVLAKTKTRKGFGLIKVNDLLVTVYGSMRQNIEQWKLTMEAGYRLHVEIEEPKKIWGGKTTVLDPNAKVLNFWCFNPAFGMANLTGRNVHSIILTSGTLAPLKPLISELGLEVNFSLENPHIIKPSQILARIIPQGPDSTALNANFNNRDNPKYISSLGMTIKTVATYTPNGLLVFFPSYLLMNKMQEAWQQSGMWNNISDVKPIFTEPKRKEEFDECIADYYRAVKISRGAIFMAVLRGKVSEGLDFKDENGRAVIIIGLPFPPYLDPHVVLKKEYLETNRNMVNQLQTGQSWYNMEATRAVNQAIGRVIRHKDDYGAIFLCDQRFHSYKSGLSRWVQSHIQQPPGGKFAFGSIIKDMNQFFRYAKEYLPKPVEVKQEPKERELDEDTKMDEVDLKNVVKREIKVENFDESFGFPKLPGSLKSTVQSMDVDPVIKKRVISNCSIGLAKIDYIDLDSDEDEASSLQKPAQHSDEPNIEPLEKKQKLDETLTKTSTKRVEFKMNHDPVRVKQEIFERKVPEKRVEFMNLIKATVEHQNYKYLINEVSKYSEKQNFEELWNGIMPMFKHLIDHVYILWGIRRFVLTEHKEQFDAAMKENFIIY